MSEQTVTLIPIGVHTREMDRDVIAYRVLEHELIQLGTFGFLDRKSVV